MLQKSYSIFFLIFILFAPASLIAAPTTLVVEAIDSDEASQKTAEIIRQKLEEKKFISVVDPKNVAEVLAYYQKTKSVASQSEEAVAKNMLAKAKEHYFQFAYVEANAELERVFQIFNNDPKLVLKEGQVLLDSWVTLALVHAAQKKNEAVVSDFKSALRLDPLFKLDSKGFAPSLHRLFEEAQNEFKKEAMGNIEIASDPKAAEIYLNGIYQGVSPLKLQTIPEGSYWLSFRANNYKSVDQNIALKADQTLKLRPKLYWAYAKQAKEKNKAEASREEIEEGLRIGSLLKVDKVLLVKADSDRITARLVDRKLRAGYQPVVIFLNGNSSSDLENHLDKLANLVAAQTQVDLLKNPKNNIDPEGIGDPILLGKRHHKIPKGFIFAGIGAVVVGGVLAGVLLSIGGGSSSHTGTLDLNFR